MPPAIIAAAAVASTAVGVIGAVKQAQDAKKARKQQAAQAKQQKIEAKEIAALSETREDTGANLDFGTSSAADELITRKSARKKKGTKATSVGASLKPTGVGGI